MYSSQEILTFWAKQFNIPIPSVSGEEQAQLSGIVLHRPKNAWNLKRIEYLFLAECWSKQRKYKKFASDSPSTTITWSHGNIFRISGHLKGKSIVYRSVNAYLAVNLDYLSNQQSSFR